MKLLSCDMSMNLRAVLDGGEVLEILTNSFVGGIVSIPYQFSFGFSLRVHDDMAIYRFYFWRLKIWASVRREGENILPGEVNSRIDW